MNKINSNNNVSFGTLRATKQGALKLLDAFENKDMEFLKKSITCAKTNIAADIFVKDNEIIVTPHKLTNYAPMRMRGTSPKKNFCRYEYYKVDYFEHDIYTPAENACYTINNSVLHRLPYLNPGVKINLFGRLFEGACHIAEDLDKSFHNKIIEAMNKEKKLNNTIKELGIDIIE